MIIAPFFPIVQNIAVGLGPGSMSSIVAMMSIEILFSSSFFIGSPSNKIRGSGFWGNVE